MDELDTAGEIMKDRVSFALLERIFDISRKDTINEDDINELVELSKCNNDRSYFNNLYGIYVADMAIALLKYIGDDNYLKQYNHQTEDRKERIDEIADSDIFAMMKSRDC